MNDLFLQALTGKNRSSRPPVWLMRQAGRYMHEYRELRKQYDLLTLFQTPELIVEITQLPIHAFGFDAAIIFSDILLIAQALGFALRFEEGIGPLLAPSLSSERDLKRLYNRDVISPFQYLFQAIRQLKEVLSVPLIGFAGAPFTLASYLIEGASSPHLRKTKKWLFEDPESFTKLLDLIAEYTIQHLNAQIEAGVDAIQLFDSWADVLPEPQFQAFSARFMKKVMDGLKKCPTILFCRGSSFFAHRLASLMPQAISLDSQCDLGLVRERLGDGISLQGNLDPDILLTNPPTVRREVCRLLAQMEGDPAFIFNLGHGILPETPRENVEALMAYVHR
jgi:uroporphyrinogen decarboxylase